MATLPSHCNPFWRRPTYAWTMKVAEYEHQFKVIDEAQKMFMAREMVPILNLRVFLM